MPVERTLDETNADGLLGLGVMAGFVAVAVNRGGYYLVAVAAIVIAFNCGRDLPIVRVTVIVIVMLNVSICMPAHY